MSNLFKLIDACCEVCDNPNYRPRSGMTFCNQAVQYIAEKMDYYKFKSMLANQMVDFMRSSPEWVSVKIEEAQEYANKGQLVIAGLRDQPHGHVAVIRPGLPGFSQKWAVPVPKVVNIGAENFIGKSLNWAFQRKPDIYVLKMG